MSRVIRRSSSRLSLIVEITFLPASLSIVLTITCYVPSSTSKSASSDALSSTRNCGIVMTPCETTHICGRSVSMRLQPGADVAIKRRCILPHDPRQRNGGMLPLHMAVRVDRPHDLREVRVLLEYAIRGAAARIVRRLRAALRQGVGLLVDSRGVLAGLRLRPVGDRRLALSEEVRYATISNLGDATVAAGANFLIT